MTPALATVVVAAITALGALLTGVIVELIKTRRSAESVVRQVHNNGGASMRDAVDRIEKRVDQIRDDQVRHGVRLEALEARASEEE